MSCLYASSVNDTSSLLDALPSGSSPTLVTHAVAVRVAVEGAGCDAADTHKDTARTDARALEDERVRIDAAQTATDAVQTAIMGANTADLRRAVMAAREAADGWGVKVKSGWEDVATDVEEPRRRVGGRRGEEEEAAARCQSRFHLLIDVHLRR